MPRALLDSPSRTAFSAWYGFPASAQFRAAGVFREGAENSARGGRAPLSISEFSFIAVVGAGRSSICFRMIFGLHGWSESTPGQACASKRRPGFGAGVLLATFKNVSAFGLKYAADFPAESIGGKPFAIVTGIATADDSLGATQLTGAGQAHAGALSKAAGRVHLHDNMLAIANATRALVLLGDASLAGKFVMPHSNGDLALLNAARAFQAAAAPLSAQLISMGLPADFLTHFATDIEQFATAIAAKNAGQTTQGGATGAIEDSTAKGTTSLHVLDVLGKNRYRANPQRLTEWAIASHVEKHTPVPRQKKTTDAPAK